MGHGRQVPHLKLFFAFTPLETQIHVLLEPPTVAGLPVKVERRKADVARVCPYPRALTATSRQ